MTVDVTQFHGIFFEESFEGLEAMESGLLALEPGAADSETINTIFRAAHSIKGGSGTFGFKQVTSFTHVLETLLDEMRDGRREVTATAVNQLLASVDVLRGMLGQIKRGEAVDETCSAQVQAALERLLGGEADDDGASAANGPDPAETATRWRIDFRPYPDMMRTGNDPLRLFRELQQLGELEVQADLRGLPPLAGLDPEELHLAWRLRLDGEAKRAQIAEVFDWVEDECELVIEPLVAAPVEPPAAVTPAQVVVTASPVADPAAPAKGNSERRGGGEGSSIRVGTNRIDALINKVGELVITQSMLSQLGEDFDAGAIERLRSGLAQLARNTRDLQESVMQIRMLPISSSFNRFPRLVHDLCTKLGKQVELEVSGEQTELDKTVLEKIGDPLVHLVRNSLDHGIEGVAERRAAGKPDAGTLSLHAAHQGGNVVIVVSDDGAGLDRERILAKAVERGLVRAGEEPSDQEVYQLIFSPGFSTVATLSDLSGRGVGMDVVRRNIHDLGGTVEIDSTLGRGTRIVIRLPLTLAILDGQLVRVGEQTYIIPIVSVVESLQVSRDSIRQIAGEAELYKLRDQYIPIIRLHRAFGVHTSCTALEKGLLVVVEGEGQRAGVFVDELLAQQQVVIKSLETNFRKVTGLSGATILGDGMVAMIVDVCGLLTLGRGHGGESPSRDEAA